MHQIQEVDQIKKEKIDKIVEPFTNEKTQTKIFLSKLAPYNKPCSVVSIGMIA